MCNWLTTLFGLVDDESVKKQLHELRKEVIYEIEVRLIDEKWKRSEQRDQIDLLKSRIRELEKKQMNSNFFFKDKYLYHNLPVAPRIVQRQPTAFNGQHIMPTTGHFTVVPTSQQRVQSTGIPVVRQPSSAELEQRVRNAATRVAHNVKTTTKTENPKEK